MREYTLERGLQDSTMRVQESRAAKLIAGVHCARSQKCRCNPSTEPGLQRSTSCISCLSDRVSSGGDHSIPMCSVGVNSRETSKISHVLPRAPRKYILQQGASQRYASVRAHLMRISSSARPGRLSERRRSGLGILHSKSCLAE